MHQAMSCSLSTGPTASLLLCSRLCTQVPPRSVVLTVALHPYVTFPTGRSRVPVQTEALAVASVAVGAAGGTLAGQAAAGAILGRSAVWGGTGRCWALGLSPMLLLGTGISCWGGAWVQRKAEILPLPLLLSGSGGTGHPKANKVFLLRLILSLLTLGS